MKYIDADRLKAEIKERFHCNGSFDECGDTAWDYDQGMVAAYNYVLSFIDSLQQEQLPGIEEHGVLGRDFIPVEWVDACEKYGKWKIVQQEQPEVDLEKEIDSFFPESYFETAINFEDAENIARHFYELGLNARKEE